jgi:hypothetical protein
MDAPVLPKRWNEGRELAIATAIRAVRAAF